MKSLYLIDLSSFIFRAYYAVRPLTTTSGIPVNALFGVVTMLQRLLEEKKPDHIAVCLDRKEKGVRHEIYPQYKANREAPPEDLIPQFPLIQEFIAATSIKTIDKKGYEADDVIATLVEKYRHRSDLQIYIVSSDKDLMQLVGKNVVLYDTMKEKILDESAVLEKFGVTPDKVVDVQSLCGDATDNVPGVSGIGPKTASKLVNEYGSLNKVLESAAHISGKVGEKIREGAQGALLAQKLVRLYSDLDLEIDWQDLEYQGPNLQVLRNFYEKVEFRSLLKNLKGETQSETTERQQVEETRSHEHFHTVDNEKDFLDLIGKIKTSHLIAIDTETTSLEALTAKLVGISLCASEKEAYYIPLAHREGKNLDLHLVREELNKLFSLSEIQFVAHNFKYDLQVLLAHGFRIPLCFSDTMIAAYLLSPDTRHNLDDLALQYLKHQTIKYDEVAMKGLTFDFVSIERATAYAAEDAWVALRLYQIFSVDLIKKNLESLYRSIELPLIAVLADMERVGILVDEQGLRDLKKDFSMRLVRLTEEIYSLAGGEFNINSPKQLAVILFEKLQLPVVKKNKTGPSTDVDVLTELSKKHDLPLKLLEFRQITKLNSTYVEGLLAILDSQTHRVHTHFNQTIAATGRLSSTDPNLQNIPIKTEEGRKLREIFIAPENHVLLSADYSQVELRLLAAFSEDPALIAAYKNDTDIHACTAAQIFGVALEEVTSQQRAIGKTINFGVIYGQSAFGLAQQLEIPPSEAQHFIDSFFKAYKRVRDYRHEVLSQAERDGFVTTYLGRRRQFPDIQSQNKMKKQMAERMAFNTIFQGSAADLIKKAMIELYRILEEKKWGSKLILQVHDELLLEVSRDEVEKVVPVVKHTMESAFDLAVPLQVNISVGKNWGEAH